MRSVRFLTAGESHGEALLGFIEGIPAGFSIVLSRINEDLKRRQGGYGRGGRMKIESDTVRILSGVRWARTTGAPIALVVENRDWQNWEEIMSAEPLPKRLEKDESALRMVTRPRPGHADLAGAMKYDHRDMRNILERSSARETAMRVALGGVAKQFLGDFGIAVGSFVTGIGSALADIQADALDEKALKALFAEAEQSPVRCPDSTATRAMVKLIDRTIREGDSLGGIFVVYGVGVPVGLGSHIQWDRKLDARLAHALMSIQAIKGVEVGLGFALGRKTGSAVMDEIFPAKKGYARRTNRAGGIEGGISNGQPIVVRGVMKPIPTLRKPLRSIDIRTGRAQKAAYERSDVCAVPAAAVVAEAMTALVLADAFIEKFGGDSRAETRRNYLAYLDQLKKF